MPGRPWLSDIRELVKAVGRYGVVEDLSPTPDFHGEAVVERLLDDLGSLEESAVLVIDDLHELRSADALAKWVSCVRGCPASCKSCWQHVGIHSSACTVCAWPAS